MEKIKKETQYQDFLLMPKILSFFPKFEFPQRTTRSSFGGFLPYHGQNLATKSI